MKEIKEIEKLLKKKVQPKNSAKTVNEWELLEFKRRLNQDCPESLLRVNPQYGNKYLPLVFQEPMLNILFDYWYPVMRHKPDFVDGNTVFYMDVVVGHPVLKTEMIYSGTAVVGIMPNETNYMVVHKQIPAGESFAILNATQKIGKVFRPQVNNFSSALDNYFEKEQEKEESEMFKRLERMIKDLDVTNPENIMKGVRWVRDAEIKKEITSEEASRLETMVTGIKYSV